MAEIDSVSWFKTWYCVCVFLPHFLVCDTGTTKKHEKNLSKIAGT